MTVPHARLFPRRASDDGPAGSRPAARFAAVTAVVFGVALGAGFAPAVHADGARDRAAAQASAAQSATAAPVDEAEVRALMQRVEAAARARDVQRLAALLADDCRIELRTHIGGDERVTTFTKAEYVEMLTSGYAAMRDLRAYDYRMSDLRVRLEPGGATVWAVVHEAAAFAGGTVATRSEETSRVERRGDALLLVAVSATTEAAPSKKVR